MREGGRGWEWGNRSNQTFCLNFFTLPFSHFTVEATSLFIV